MTNDMEFILTDNGVSRMPDAELEDYAEQGVLDWLADWLADGAPHIDLDEMDKMWRWWGDKFDHVWD